jgi:hypothetical protein
MTDGNNAEALERIREDYARGKLDGDEYEAESSLYKGDSTDPQASTPTRQREKARTKALPSGEIWVADDGTVGFTAIIDGKIVSKTSDEWWQNDNEMADMIDARYEKALELYPLAGCPEPYLQGQEDKALLKDIASIIHRFVDLPPREGKLTGEDSPYYAAQAAWCIGSALAKRLSVRPRWFPRGQTKFGKTRGMTVSSYCSYRGCLIGNPTAPLVYRLVSDYDVTLFIDEFQDLDAETRRAILDVLKLGFDGTSIKRVNMDRDGDIQSFSNKTFSALAIKDSELPEDVLNRGIPVPMGIKTRELDKDDPSDNDEFKAIRTRLVALKLKVDAGIIDYQVVRARAKELSLMPFRFRGKKYVLDGRDRNIAEVLLIPVVLMGENEADVNDIMEVMVRSTITADDQNRDMMPCRAWFALYEEVMNCGACNKLDDDSYPVFKFKPRIEGSHIRLRLVNRLHDMGDIKQDSDVKTSQVTGLLQSLGFTFDRSHANIPVLELGNTFKVAWRNALIRYGMPTTEDSEEGCPIKGGESVADWI